MKSPAEWATPTEASRFKKLFKSEDDTLSYFYKKKNKSLILRLQKSEKVHKNPNREGPRGGLLSRTIIRELSFCDRSDDVGSLE